MKIIADLSYALYFPFYSRWCDACIFFCCLYCQFVVWLFFRFSVYSISFDLRMSIGENQRSECFLGFYFIQKTVNRNCLVDKWLISISGTIYKFFECIIDMRCPFLLNLKSIIYIHTLFWFSSIDFLFGVGCIFLALSIFSSCICSFFYYLCISIFECEKFENAK